MTKRCSKCKQEKPLSQFNKSRHSKTGLVSQCTPCRSKAAKEYRHKNPHKVKQDITRIWKYHGVENFTIEDYNLLFQQQKGCCKICGRHQKDMKKRLHLDHCHKTGKVRGLLCSHCNSVLGFALDNVTVLENAVKYLKNQRELV